ncbi:hypothetical protein [Aurantibacillus circumpalustris]|uniref:hypothetical protein n=1 Tax=Aurantibacillus circumpalustris TaxID=3036359 RepID=UPI00295B84CC|nr:hypothetical protein [Aurantibacillus circumpalustris]
MKKSIAYFVFTVAVFLTSCKKKEEPVVIDPPVTPCQKTIVNVTSDITSPATWDECHIYVIASNQISISSELTINPGVIVKFIDACSDNAILISSSGNIKALGTVEKPIVFTSHKDDANGGDSNGDGSTTFPARKDWGGIVINSNSCEFKHCVFKYGGEGPGGNVGQPTLEFSSYYGIIDACEFAYCGGESTYNGYGVVDARACHNTSFSITNCIFYGCIKPLFINPFLSVDNSNTFHNPENLTEKNNLNGIFITSESNEATTDVSWLETEVPFVLSGSLYIGNGLKLKLAENVIIKMADLPAPGFNKISIREGSSSIEGYSLPGVYFTSYYDDSLGGDTNGDGGLTNASSGDWYGIQDISASIGTNNFCYSWSNILFRKYP